MKLTRQHIELTAKVMDLQLERQNLVMANLANIATPNYRPREIAFEKELQRALNQDAHGRMTRTDQGHMPAVFDPNSFEGHAGKVFKPRYVYGEDSVNLDKEMASMSKNTLQYNTLTTIMQRHFTGVNKVITEGSK